jgi:hypothetical protein
MGQPITLQIKTYCILWSELSVTQCIYSVTKIELLVIVKP